jgi:hypothetical protein
MSLPGRSGGDATRRGPDAVTTSVISPSPDLTATVKLSVWECWGSEFHLHLVQREDEERPRIASGQVSTTP